MAEYFGIKTDGEFFVAPEEYRFIQFYKQNWAKVMEHTYYKEENIDWGHRLRPRLVYWGFLSETIGPVSDRQMDVVSKGAVCIELIHKSSLLLDDYIDKDTMRHGSPSFYTVYGVEKTVMYTIHLLCMALKTLTDILYQDSIRSSYYYKSMTALIQTLYNMSLGVLMELDLTRDDMGDINKVKEIMDLETSALIENSLLLGYYLTQSEDSLVENVLVQVGEKLGYIFQVLNDLEPYCSANNDAHKGSTNTDIMRNRKNICFPLLMGVASNKDKKKLACASDSELVFLLNKYGIKELLLTDVQNTITQIKQDITSIKSLAKRHEWSAAFTDFIDSVIRVFQNRLT